MGPSETAPPWPRLGIQIPYGELHDRDALTATVREAEALGYSCVWSGEGYTYDAFTTLTHLADATSCIGLATNVAQVFSRSPALLAATAASLDQLSGGRFALGVGASGPQVVEGWHGVAYDRPIARTREVVEICRTIWGGHPLDHDGQAYQMRQGLTLLNAGHRHDIPIFVAALGEKNVALAAEVAEGWLPYPFSTEKAGAVFGPSLAAGLSRRHPSRPALRVAPMVPVFVGDRDEGLEAARAMLGLYIGGMGSLQTNFYSQIVQRYGFAEQAVQAQQEFVVRRDKKAAIAAIPDELVDQCSIIGDAARVRDRVQDFAHAGASDLVLAFLGDRDSRVPMMRTLAEVSC